MSSFDTNVLMHADDARNPRKRGQARELIRALMANRRGVVSLQVIQEFFAAATRKLGLSSEHARRRMVVNSRFDVVTFAPADLLAAIDLHRIHRFSIWDSLIMRAALNANCTMLHSEDMSTGHRIVSLTISNPFAAPHGN